MQAMRRKGSAALVDLVEWLLSNATDQVPPLILEGLSKLDTQDLEDELAELLDQDGLDAATLHRLAAIALATALIVEQQDREDQDDDSKYPTQKRHSNPR